MVIAHMREFFIAWHDRGPIGKCKLLLYIIVRICYILINHVWVIPTYIVWMIVVLPLKFLWPSLYWRIEAKFFRWLLAMIAQWIWMAGYEVYESNVEALEPALDAECLVLINHQSTGDVALLFHCLQYHGHVVERVSWLMDKQFMYTEFGAVSVIHGDFFILQGREHRHTQLTLLKQHLLEKYWPRPRQWLMLFPEGGFLRKRRKNSQIFAQKNGHPHLEHVTLPRVGAMSTILDTIGPRHRQQVHDKALDNNCVQPHTTDEGVASSRAAAAAAAACNEVMLAEGGRTQYDSKRLKYIVDLTIAYPELGARPVDLQTIVFGWRDPCRTSLHYRVYDLNTVPYEDVPRLTQWLYDRWQEKEALIEHYYEHGQFTAAHPLTRCHMNVVWLFLLHVIFAVSTGFHYYLYRSISAAFS